MRYASLIACVVAVGLMQSSSAVADQPNKTTGSTTAQSIQPQQPRSESMERLVEAAQKLRHATQEMTTQPAGPRRNKAMQEARDALMDTQRAMLALPPALRTGHDGPGVNYTESMERLREAAQKLREAVQAMATQPAGASRNEAIDQANGALFDTQQAQFSYHNGGITMRYPILIGATAAAFLFAPVGVGGSRPAVATALDAIVNTEAASSSEVSSQRRWRRSYRFCANRAWRLGMEGRARARFIKKCRTGRKAESGMQ